MTDARLSDINSGNWITEYLFNGNGDMASRTIQSGTGTFTYDGHQTKSATGDENFTLYYDENGQLTAGPSGQSLVYNWDGKLRSATKGGTTINLKYDPAGNRIYKETNNGATKRKYIVDVIGDLPTVLLELDPNNSMEIKKTYIYSNSQILAEHNGSYSAPRYFYLHDRLGSVRQVINSNAVVVKMFTFNPFGETIEDNGSFYTPWRFTGQYLDNETGQYYLRARQYDTYIYRFTSRDLIWGDYEQPLSLHKYLYCENDPINRIDPLGLDYFDFNFTYPPVGLVPGGAAGSFYGPWGTAGGVALGGLGFTGGLMWEAGLTHTPARVASIHPYFGFSWSASPMPSVTATKTYSLQDLPTKKKGTTGWQVAVTFSTPWLAAYQIGMDVDTGKRFEERGISVSSHGVIPLSFSLFYVFDDFTYGPDDDLDKAVMLGDMYNNGSFLSLQQRYLLMAGMLDETTSSCFSDAAEYQWTY